MSRGRLRVYLGAAPGVGKTFAMLGEGRRARDRGVDVVVGYVETHGRPRTAEQIGDLEVLPRVSIDYRGTTFEELDIDAIIERKPERVLVDELAHTNVPGSRNEKRWQDVEEILDAGIDVISTVNIQHLESVNDLVEQITGITQHETIPDEIVRAAEQVEIVDQTPEALRRRMAHGNIYAADKIDAALSNYFRSGNLTALRELALLWLSDKVGDALDEYRERHGISQPWATRERIVVAVTGSPSSDPLIRRAARIAQRTHSDLIGVHIRSDDGLAVGHDEHLDRHRALLAELGAEYRVITGSDAAGALIEFARSQNATQIVLGSSNRSRWQELVNGSIVNRVLRLSRYIDIHVVTPTAPDPDTRTAAPRRRRRRPLGPLPPRRRNAGFLLATVGLPLLTLGLAALRDDMGLSSVLLLYLAAVLVIGAVGGALPALVAAIAAVLFANYYFAPPIHRFTISAHDNVIAVVVFALTAALVSYLVDSTARRRDELTRVKVEAEAMARMAGSLTDPELLPRLVEQIRISFGATRVAIIEDLDGHPEVELGSGAPIDLELDDPDVAEPLGDGRTLVVQGAHLSGDDHRLLHALTNQAALALQARRLKDEADRSEQLARANDLRAGLLQAVSHDLRTPLASIKASVTSLRQDDITWEPEQQSEFLETIEEETDRLAGLVESLLEMSRLQAGVITPRVVETSAEEVVPGALAGLGARAQTIVVDLPDDLPTFDADPQLLERVVANLVDNALKYSDPEVPPRLTAGAIAGQVLIRVVDHGPGIDPRRHAEVFEPFQRYVDHGHGVGLGLAIARGFTTAMGGELGIEDTPGGGATMVVTLPIHENAS